MFYQQPPVGNPVVLSGSRDPACRLDRCFSPYHGTFYVSGTAALAAALIAAKKRKPVERPEVVLPAYGCPDLISAASFAGLRPVLVDLERNRPWVDLQQLPAKLTDSTVGIVAVDLFGISERFRILRELASSRDILLIEDSAQAFPNGGESSFWQGDLVVISFGRGKPVSLLGGGAVLSRDQQLRDLLPAPEEQVFKGWPSSAMYRLKAGLYNRMISPHLYWAPQGLPFLHLGETRYHPLTDLGAMDATRLALLPANIDAYRRQPRDTYHWLRASFQDLGSDEAGLVDLPKSTGTPIDRRLLRYPLLVAPATRHSLFHALRRAGLGPSLMYPVILPEISGVQRLLEKQGPFPQARSFAERILTLPTHSRVSDRNLCAMRDLIIRQING
ncbi:MAG: DegT/DnrJ/EryC1/StrS family aminotransferase [Gammaproteobacteria bacterium]|nr:DegT/DnrJ/EryC1/StrS family aminotransferase [Gammaproteobacteria bacterium]